MHKHANGKNPIKDAVSKWKIEHIPLHLAHVGQVRRVPSTDINR